MTELPDVPILINGHLHDINNIEGENLTSRILDINVSSTIVTGTPRLVLNNYPQHQTIDFPIYWYHELLLDAPILANIYLHDINYSEDENPISGTPETNTTNTIIKGNLRLVLSNHSQHQIIDLSIHSNPILVGKENLTFFTTIYKILSSIDQWITTKTICNVSFLHYIFFFHHFFFLIVTLTNYYYYYYYRSIPFLVIDYYYCSFFYLKNIPPHYSKTLSKY